jgi:hypothetical protein
VSAGELMNSNVIGFRDSLKKLFPGIDTMKCCLAICLRWLLAYGTCYSLPSELPEVEVTSLRRVFHNGEHNAFTDLCRFEDNSI